MKLTELHLRTLFARVFCFLIQKGRHLQARPSSTRHVHRCNTQFMRVIMFKRCPCISLLRPKLRFEVATFLPACSGCSNMLRIQREKTVDLQPTGDYVFYKRQSAIDKIANLACYIVETCRLTRTKGTKLVLQQRIIEEMSLHGGSNTIYLYTHTNQIISESDVLL